MLFCLQAGAGREGDGFPSWKRNLLPQQPKGHLQAAGNVVCLVFPPGHECTGVPFGNSGSMATAETCHSLPPWGAAMARPCSDSHWSSLQRITNRDHSEVGGWRVRGCGWRSGWSRSVGDRSLLIKPWSPGSTWKETREGSGFESRCELVAKDKSITWGRFCMELLRGEEWGVRSEGTAHSLAARDKVGRRVRRTSENLGPVSP